MRLLIADLVRRNRWKAALSGVLLAAMFGEASLGTPTLAFWFSMGMTFGLGPAITLGFVPRLIWYLPVAKRDVWRAGWLVGTLGVTLVTTAAKLAAILVPQLQHSLGLASIVLSSVYDFAYAGAGCGLVILATWPLPTSGPWRPVSVFQGLAASALALGLPLALLGNLVAGDRLPIHWMDLTARSAAVLVAALSLAVATYFHSPVPPTPANRSSRRSRVKSGTPRFELDGLSGLPYLLAHEAVWTLMLGAFLVGGSALFVFVAAGITQSSEGFVGLLRSTLLTLDTGRVKLEPDGGFGAFSLLIAFAVFATSLAPRFPSMMRHLRVLPLGPALLNALLIAWPAAFWLAAWTALLTLRYVILGQVLVLYHVNALVGLIGLSAIVQAMTLRLPRLLRPLTFSALLLPVPLLLLVNPLPPAASVAFGLGGLAVAAVLNHRSLARRSTYAPIGVQIRGVQTL